MSLHALIDFAACADAIPPLRLAFGTPQRELIARSPEEVRHVLREVQALSERGFWCVGYLRYEAATAFEPGAAVHPADGPLACFSVHERPIAWPELLRQVPASLHWRRRVERAQFDAALHRIHAAIAAGEVYQVNYTAAVESAYEGDPFDLFCALRRSQSGANAAYVRNTEEAVLSASPELFFDWRGDTLLCRPMKGTAARGSTQEDDLRNMERLRGSAKERAENVMIVDLIRNDMSRVAELGSVQVSRLFDCEPWPTVWQMTSTVVARTRQGTTLLDLFQALFPCGSVTGAPKLRAMHWIRETEVAPRGVYCGAVGVVQPGAHARFNVPIRTVIVREGRASCGIGSGITADASADGEWSEWGAKMQFLEQASHAFRLLQTVRVANGQPCELELHLQRIDAAAAHFGFVVDCGRIRGQVLAACEGSAGQARARILVDVRGEVRVEVSAAPPPRPGLQPVVLAAQPVRAPTAFLRHKTTQRAHFEPFAADVPGVFDTLLWNERGEVTEFTRGNVIVERADGERITPPLACGLLDGVGRARELAAGRAREGIVRVDELGSVRALWFVNALRGVMPVCLGDPGSR